MGYIDNLTTEERVSYLIKPILEVLSQSSNSLTTAELRSQIIKMDPYIAEYAEAVYTSEKTGIPYKDFTKRFSLAIKELEVLGILSREGKGQNSSILLTPKGQELDISTLNVEKEIRAKAQVYWKARRKKMTKKKTKSANVAKNEKRLLWRATANFKESGFSWYQLEVGDIVTYNYATEKNIEIGRFGLGYNKDSGEGSNEPAGSIVCVFQIVDYLMLPDSQTNKAVLRCVHKFDNPYVFRTTIYRDYSYFDFVGNIMPVTKDGKISYEFVPGIFTTALFAALRNQDSGIDVYLILEEMSRGDIASIFGDIFQLLDRDDTGKSMYGINNKSIYEYLILNRALKPGYKIVIPKNLHIIGTVNTSDQNVNVIDTAFKRRFDFKYVGVEPIKSNNGYVNNFSIKFTSAKQYEWVKLYQAINHVIINDLGLAEDKQLGPFFLKDKGNDNLNRKQVANKLLHYLWQDVERVSYTSGSLFADGITSFSQLYYAFKKQENILSKSVIEQYGKL